MNDRFRRLCNASERMSNRTQMTLASGNFKRACRQYLAALRLYKWALNSF